MSDFIYYKLEKMKLFELVCKYILGLVWHIDVFSYLLLFEYCYQQDTNFDDEVSDITDSSISNLSFLIYSPSLSYITITHLHYHNTWFNSYWSMKVRASRNFRKKMCAMRVYVFFTISFWNDKLTLKQLGLATTFQQSSESNL